MLLEYIVGYENASHEFDIEHCWIKVKVTVDLFILVMILSKIGEVQIFKHRLYILALQGCDY